ncbi:MAG: LexA family transcriptional regulator [Desulfobacteraceae bacterium]
MDMDELTPRQQSVLDFIVEYQKEHRMAPSVREIGEHLGLSAPAGIHRLLHVLKEKGYIVAEPGKKRSWSVFGGDNCFGLRVKGDSMIGAHIQDGDIAIIRPQKQVGNGVIAAVLVEDLLTEATLKIVQRTGTALTLKAANPACRSLVFRYGGRKRVSIVGKLVGVVRRG